LPLKDYSDSRLAAVTVTTPVASTTRRRGLTAYRPMIAALAGYVLLRGTVMFNGYLYADDYALRWWAHNSGLTPEYLFRSYYGHVQPWGLLAQWVLQAGWPGSWTALMVWSLIMQLATLVLLWRIMLRLTGSNLAALLAFLVPAASMFTFEVGVWWCMVIESAPYGLFMMMSIYALIRALEGDCGRWWLWSGLAFGAAVLAISKGTLFLLIPILIAAYLPIGAARRRGLRAAFRLNPRYWVSITAFTVLYAIFLRLHAPISRDPNWDLVRAIRYSRDLFLLNIVNGSAGGPWRWFSAPGETWNGVLVIPYQSGLLMGVAVLLLLGVFIVVRRYRPNLWPYLLGMLVYALALTAVAAYGRGGSVVASTGYRYTSDFWILLALFAGLLFFAVRGEADPFPRPVLWPRRTLAVVAALALTVSSLVSAVEPSLRWVNSQTKDYVRAAQASMAQIPADAQFLPQKTMTDLVHPLLMLPYASTEVVFAPDPVFRPFSRYPTGGLYGFTTAGPAEQQWLAGVSSAAPLGTCGYRLASQPVAIQMAQPVPEWSFVAEVSYLAAADTTIRMTVGPDTHDVPIQAGLHNVFFEVWGPAEEVTAQLTDPAVAVCIDRVTIGARVGPDSPAQIFPAPADALR
jgi:hypothetical protein